MDKGFKEQKYTIDGIPSKIVCHIQKGKGKIELCAPHYHDYIELLYCLEGSLNLWLNDRHYRAKQGDLVLINSNEVHQIAGFTEGTHEYCVLRFEPEMLYDSSQSIFETKYVLPFILNNASPQKVFTNREICTTDIPRLVNDSCKEFAERKYGYELAIRSNICRIFLWILRYWNECGIDFHSVSENNTEIFEKIQSVLDYLMNHYDENITALEMANYCGLSYSYFSRTFKQLMKRNFNDYLNYVRIKEAEKLLMTTKDSITDIAFQVGFSSASYFIHIFSEHKNISPTQYRKKSLA